MIRLVDLLVELGDKEDRSVWRTYANRYGARNTVGQVRYFADRESAAAFAPAIASALGLALPF